MVVVVVVVVGMVVVESESRSFLGLSLGPLALIHDVIDIFIQYSCYG